MFVCVGSEYWVVFEYVLDEGVYGGVECGCFVGIGFGDGSGWCGGGCVIGWCGLIF